MFALQVGNDINLETTHCQSPCIVAFATDSELQDVFLLSQGETVCRGEPPATSACDAMKLLLGGYYLFDRKYPKYYDGLLTFLECQLFNVQKRPTNLTHIKFVQKYVAISGN